MEQQRDGEEVPEASQQQKRELGATMTSASPGFIANYFASSRLHHLSTWKSDLIDFVGREMAQKKPSKIDSVPRVIMHVDMDCFFASVAIRDRPHLKGKPVAVAHSTGGINLDYSSSEIASCNYEARARGIKNGMFIGSIKKLAPDLVIIPYEFSKYDACSQQIYRILIEKADYVQAVSCDEAYIDVSIQIRKKLLNEGLLDDEEQDLRSQQMVQRLSVQLAEEIRREILAATGCPASIGISHNLLLARLATTRAKPDGVFLLDPSQTFSMLNELSVRDLPGFGHNLMEKCTRLNVSTCKDVRSVSFSLLKKELGERTAQSLLEFSQGIDNRMLENKLRQSVGGDVNWGIRFTEEGQVAVFLREFSEDIFQRLAANDLAASHLTVNVKKKLYHGEPGKFLGCGHCQDFSKSTQTALPIRSAAQLFEQVHLLYREIGVPFPEVRGVGIHLKRVIRNGLGLSNSSSLSGPEAEGLPSQAISRQKTIASLFSQVASRPLLSEKPQTSIGAPPATSRSNSIAAFFQTTSIKEVSPANPRVTTDASDEDWSRSSFPAVPASSSDLVATAVICGDTCDSIDLTRDDADQPQGEATSPLPTSKRPEKPRSIDQFFRSDNLQRSPFPASPPVLPLAPTARPREKKRLLLSTFFEPTKPTDRRTGEHAEDELLLEESGIDLDVFAALPSDIRREQLALLRANKRTKKS